MTFFHLNGIVVDRKIEIERKKHIRFGKETNLKFRHIPAIRNMSVASIGCCRIHVLH